MTNYVDHAVSLANFCQIPHPGSLCEIRREAEELGEEQDQAVNQIAADIVGCDWREKPR